ncbi:MAG: hypothetical protein FJ271_08855 [Planctomycetes bacterium]|nr:hypothetical protein [Planctomycetota bacterium]
MNAQSSLATPTGLGWRSLSILAIFAGSLIFWHLGSARTLTSHEAPVVQGAIEMLASGQWLTPTLCGEPWLEKPPLAHWAIAALGWLCGGIDERVARLPSGACGILGVLLLASLAARLRGRNFGLLVGLIVSTSVWFITYARLAEADIYLWLLTSACLCVFVRHETTLCIHPAAARRQSLIFFVLLGLTNLAKGIFFGAALVLAICICWALTQRSRQVWRFLLNPTGWAIFIALAAAWPLLVMQVHPEAMATWWQHSLGRAAHGLTFSQPAWYYASTLPWQVLPWTLAMMPGLWSSFKQARRVAGLDRLLWIWLLVPAVLLSCSRGKHHHYLIHALPPCAFWAAEGLHWWVRQFSRLRHWRARRLLFTVALALPSVAGAALHARLGSAIAWEIAIVGTLSAGLAVLAGQACIHGRQRLALISLFVLLWTVYGYVHARWLKRTDTYRQETQLFLALNHAVESGADVRIFQNLAARARFYTRRAIKSAWTTRGLPPAGERPRYVVAAMDCEAELRQAGFAPCLVPIPPADSFAQVRRVYGLFTDAATAHDPFETAEPPPARTPRP